MRNGFNERKLCGRRGKKAGFSLVEVLVAASLSSLILAAVISSFIFVARSSMGVSNYSDMNSQSRIGLEIFGRDVRNAEGIDSGFTATEFTLQMPDNNGTPAPSITYVYRPGLPNRPLVRIEAGEEKILMTGVEELTFNYTNLQGQTNANMAAMEVKQIQLRLTLLRRTIALKNTERVVSARFILRNQEVT